MKIVKKVTKTTILKQIFKSEIEGFCDQTKRFQNQFTVQIYLEENLRPNYVCIPMDFAENYRYCM